jgi:EAL domain-containing protein (putative c-di-GMP-specific phosphodiesterase class I)
VLPAELLPAAERLRLGAEIGEWALHTACRQVSVWRRRGHDLWLAINVTPRQLTAADFVPEVAAALSVHQDPPERLTVEVSEADVGDQLGAVAAQLSRLRALGVRTGLDDVGTRQTDLARLRRLPLDVVKLCPTASTTTGGEPVSEVAAAVVDVARRLGATVVAEGLETEEQRRLVRQAGCQYGQGYLVAAPSPAEHLEAFLERHRR